LLVAFDLDDTLYLERDFVFSGYHAVDNFLRKSYGIEGVQEAATQLFMKGVRTNVFDEALGRLGARISHGLVSECVEIYQDHSPVISLTTSRRAFLSAIGSCHELAIVTDGKPITQRNKIAALGIQDFFSHIIVTGEHGDTWRKPSPLPFSRLEVLSRLFGGDCAYVADNPLKDFLGPQELGWRVIRVRPEGGIYSHYPTPKGIPETSDTETCLDYLPWV
jgi:putative hydrolase of the HAD superfamily